MDKYQAKYAAKRKPRRRSFFWLGMLLYAAVFLGLTAWGLKYLWSFMESYEASRPKNTMDAYLQQLTPEQIARDAEDFLAEFDTRLQSEQTLRGIVADSVTQELTYAKKSGESTEDRQVYAIRCGSRTIGQVDILAGEPDEFGCRVWQVNEAEFCFSDLIGQPMSVTVPEDYRVCFNGTELDEKWITERDIPYAVFEEFADSYDTPTLVSYRVEGYLGQGAFSVTDPAGEPVALTEEMDWTELALGCDEELTQILQELTGNFLQRYITFTGSHNNIRSNYNAVLQYTVKDGALAQRLEKVIEGQKFAQSGGDTVISLDFHHCLHVSQGYYMTDITYVIRTIGKKGPVDTTNNMKLICTDTPDGIRVEAIVSY